MSRFSSGWKTGGAGSSTLPIAGLVPGTGVRPRLVEVGVFNTTTTAVELQLRRISAAGTAGSTQTAVYEDDDSATVNATAKDTWTVAPTFVTGNLRQATLGAAAGSGVIWTFGGGKTPGLVLPASIADGVVIVPVGTGQICDVWFVWDE